MTNQQFSPLSSQPKISSLPGIGDLLSRTWQIYKERIWVFFGIMVLPWLVNFFIIGLPITFLYTSRPQLMPVLPLILIILVTVLIVINLWAGVALIYAIKEREQKIGIKESFIKGWHKIIPYLWISFLVGIVTFIGFLLFIIPGIIFAVWFSLATYVLVAEDLTGTKALSRSKQLVSDNWWRVFWRLIAISIISLAFLLIFNFIIVNNAISGSMSIPIYVFSPLILLSFIPFATIYGFLIYEDLRRIKGGASF